MRTDQARGVRAIILAGLLGLACGEAGEPAAAPVEGAATPVEVEVVDDCSRVFSPDDELLDETLDAAARWSATTGCDVSVGEGGMPVTLVAELLTSSGEYANGGATVYARDGAFDGCDGLTVAETTDDRARTVAHEMGHCLGAMGHASDGLLMARPPTATEPINAAALALVCEALPCRVMAPEITSTPTR